jgi:hypothetical protein
VASHCECWLCEDPKIKKDVVRTNNAKRELQAEINRITVVMQRGCPDHDQNKSPYCEDFYEYLIK